VLTLIEVAGSALVAFLYLAILATALSVKTRRKPAVPHAEDPGTPGSPPASYDPYDRAVG
jgi:hypothetical protein